MEMSNLFYFRFQGYYWEHDDNAWRYFDRKILNEIKGKRLIFLQIRKLFIVEIGKSSSKSCTKQWTYCTAKTLSCNRWTECDLCQHQKMTGKTKKRISTPALVCKKVMSTVFTHLVIYKPKCKKQLMLTVVSEIKISNFRVFYYFVLFYYILFVMYF